MGRTPLQLASRKLARGCEPSYRKSYSSLVSLFSYPLSTIGEFLWDGLAFIRRNDEHFINEPHVGNAPKKLRFEGKPRAQRSARRARKGPRGNPIASSKGTSYFNDVLGTTVGAKKDGKYSPAALSAFGERLDNIDSTSPAIRSLGEGWFTGKPYVEGLGHAFLMRNYRAGLAKWQTADSIGYPDGWNQLAYGPNSPLSGVDFLGASWGDVEMVAYYFRYTPISLMSPPLRSIWDLIRPLVVDDSLDTDTMGLTDAIFSIMDAKAHEIIDKYVATEIAGAFSGDVSKRAYSQSFGVDCGSIVWALGGGSGNLLGELSFSWSTKYETDNRGCRYMIKSYSWEFVGEMKYSDSFKDPIDVINYIDRPDLEAPTGAPYDYGHIWRNYRAVGQGEKRFLEE